MKAISLLTFSIFFLISYGQTTLKPQNLKHTQKIVFDFDEAPLNILPQDWSELATGKDAYTKWVIREDNGNHVLAQISNDHPNYHFNVIVYDKLQAKDVELEVKLKGVSGNMDQGGGFVWRFLDANNYYVVRANPLEDNVVMYKVENGERTDLPLINKGRTYGVDVPALGNDWNTLKLKAQNDIFTVYLNGKEIFKVKDQTFTNTGKVGLWTKADAVSYFDDFSIRTL